MYPSDDTRAWLAAIVTSSDDAIVSKDLNGIVTSWNGAAERLFGYTAAEMIGRSITLIVPPERLAEEDFVLSRVRAGIGVDHFETVRQRKNGERVEISLTVSAVRNQQGVIIGASKIARDIGDRKRLERDALRLSAIVEWSADAIIGMDLAGTIQSWNRGAERIFGYRADEIIGQPITVIVPDDRREEHASVLPGIARGETFEPFETVRCHKDGRRLDMSLTVSPIRAASGEVLGASKIARDVTEQKRLREELASASRAKDEFLATLSHELRTPLNTVLGYTKMLQQGAISDTDVPRILSVVSRNALALTQLVNDVLDTSRIVTGKLRLELRQCEIDTVVSAAAEGIAPSAAAKSITVVTDVQKRLLAKADPDRFQQVLWNLLSNAVKFTPFGGTVTVRAWTDDRNVHVSVADTGAGIAPHALPFVFQRFWQGESQDSRVGLGLGLALARHFVELHGGHIEARSDGLGHGARFEVTLPQTVGEPAAPHNVTVG